MSALTDTRDHCRRMATAQHKPECPSLERRRDRWALADDNSHLTWVPAPPRRECAGCVTDTDRALFARLADEIDRYLGAARDEPLEAM